MPPPLTPVSNHIHSSTIPSVWNDDNVSPVSEWDDAFEGPLLSIELSLLVHLSLEELEVSTLPFTLAHVNDWAHHTPTEVFISLSPPHTHTNPLHIERLFMIVIQFSLRRHDFLPSLMVYRGSPPFLLAMAKGLFITPNFLLRTASWCRQGCPWVTREYWKIALLRYLKMRVKLWIIYRQVRIFNAHLNQFSDKKSSHWLLSKN